MADVLRRDIVVIGASAGGIKAVSRLLSLLPPDLRAAFLVVLHIPPNGGAVLPHILGKATSLPVGLGVDNEPLPYGEVRVAPGNHHLLVEPGRLRVVHGPRENRFRPAIDPLFRSAAWAYGPRVIGVLLSGMLSDGSAGLWAIKTCGGVAVVQAPDEAAFPDMPQNALAALPVDHCLSVSGIASLLATLVNETVPVAFAPKRPDQVRIETEMASQNGTRDIDTMDDIGKLSPYTCPACQGALWEVFDDHVLRFRCHTGHAFTADSLDAGQGEEYEAALFGALRALEQNARLARGAAERSRNANYESAARIHDERAETNDRHADVIRRLLARSDVAAS